MFVTWPVEPGWIVEQGCQDNLIDHDTPPEGVLLACLWTASPGGELHGGTLQMVSDGRLTEGQGTSLLAIIDVAQALYQGGWLIAADNVLQAYQNELLALRGVITPDWLVAEGLQGFIESLIDSNW